MNAFYDDAKHTDTELLLSERDAPPHAELLNIWGRGRISDAAWSHSGSTLIIADSMAIGSYDVNLHRRRIIAVASDIDQVAPAADDLLILATERTLICQNLHDDATALVAVAPSKLPITIAISPLANLAAVDTGDAITIYRLPSGELIACLDAYSAGGRGSMAFSADNRRLAVAVDGRVWIWDVETCEATLVIGDGSTPIIGVAFAPDRQTLVSAGGGFVMRWRLDDGALMEILADDLTGVQQVAVAADGAVAAAAPGRVYLWPAALSAPLRLHGPSGTPMRLAFDPSGRHLLMAASGGVQLWSSDQGIARASLNDRWAGVSDIAFSPDGQRLASIAGVGRLWWIGASRIEHVLPFARNATMSAAIAFDPTGVLLALGSDSEIQVCDAASGDLVYTVPVRLAQSGGLSFTYDGSRLVAVSDTCVQIRRAADGVLVDTIDCADADDVVIAPDRSSLALVRGAEVAIWDLDSVTCRTPLAIPTTTYEVALAAGGRIMATATEAGIRVVRTDTGEQISYLPGHALRLALHPEGHILAAVYDRAINIYRVADGALLARATGHTDTITCLDFAPDTRHLASGSRDGTVRLWRYPGA